MLHWNQVLVVQLAQDGVNRRDWLIAWWFAHDAGVVLFLTCYFRIKSEKDDSEDVPNGVCEGPVTRENPLFWNGEADRGVADEDVGLVHREVSSSEQLRELGFMETQRALPPVPGLQAQQTENQHGYGAHQAENQHGFEAQQTINQHGYKAQ
ncbi:hypothetical protein V6N12_062136 [Hibiscus sabdariffa]|uniref:Uncharacterized protein n=1 Tax=Hibiscus sabdariffa TaxID=183260 RepID=A0ABR2F7Y0_9ROSI